LKLKIGDDNYNLPFKRLASAVNAMGLLVVKEAQNELELQDKVVTGQLKNSLTYTVTTGKDEVTLEFGAGAPYWDFVNQGVRGAVSSAKAPNSPYQFGTGSHTGRGTLRGGIDRWVIQKPIEGVRDMKTGRFLPRKELVRRISSTIWNTGIEPSNYYTLALDRGWKRAKKRIGVAIGLDVNDFMVENFGGDYIIDITI